MTPEGRAFRLASLVIYGLEDGVYVAKTDATNVMFARIEEYALDAMQRVIAEEREACAKLADRCTPDNPNHADYGCCASDIAAAIRGRA